MKIIMVLFFLCSVSIASAAETSIVTPYNMNPSSSSTVSIAQGSEANIYPWVNEMAIYPTRNGYSTTAVYARTAMRDRINSGLYWWILSTNDVIYSTNSDQNFSKGKWNASNTDGYFVCGQTSYSSVRRVPMSEDSLGNVYYAGTDAGVIRVCTSVQGVYSSSLYFTVQPSDINGDTSPLVVDMEFDSLDYMHILIGGAGSAAYDHVAYSGTSAVINQTHIETCGSVSGTMNVGALVPDAVNSLNNYTVIFGGSVGSNSRACHHFLNNGIDNYTDLYGSSLGFTAVSPNFNGLDAVYSSGVFYVSSRADNIIRSYHFDVVGQDLTSPTSTPIPQPTVTPFVTPTLAPSYPPQPVIQGKQVSNDDTKRMFWDLAFLAFLIYLVGFFMTIGDRK